MKIETYQIARGWNIVQYRIKNSMSLCGFIFLAGISRPIRTKNTLSHPNTQQDMWMIIIISITVALNLTVFMGCKDINDMHCTREYRASLSYSYGQPGKLFVRSHGISIIHVNKSLTTVNAMRFGFSCIIWCLVLNGDLRPGSITKVTVTSSYNAHHSSNAINMGSRNYGYQRLLFEIQSLKMKLILAINKQMRCYIIFIIIRLCLKVRCSNV